MEYRLKKDLPFAKAGSTIKLNNKMLDHNCISIKGTDELGWKIGFYEDLDRLVKEGWIEEVKPRELNPLQLEILITLYSGTRDPLYENQFSKEVMSGLIESGLIEKRPMMDRYSISDKGDKFIKDLLEYVNRTYDRPVWECLNNEFQEKKESREYQIQFDEHGYIQRICRTNFPQMTNKDIGRLNQTIKVREVIE